MLPVVLVATWPSPEARLLSLATSRQLTEKDTIVLSDFTNTTGEPVFDDTLKQGLSVQLGQSPFLLLISDRKVNEILKQMGRPAGDRLTPEVAREVCLRTGSKAMLAGSIASLGKQVRGRAEGGELRYRRRAGRGAGAGRRQGRCAEGVDSGRRQPASAKLGESLSSVHQFDAPLEGATTLRWTR